MNRFNERARDHPLLSQINSNVVEYQYSPVGGSPGKRSWLKDGGAMSHRLSPLSSHGNLELGSRLSPDHSGHASPRDQYVRHGSPRGQLKLPPITINFGGIDHFSSTSPEDLKKSWYEQTNGRETPVRAKENLRRVSSDSQAIANKYSRQVPAITVDETLCDTREMSARYKGLWQHSIHFILEENQKKRENAQDQCKWLQKKVRGMYFQNKSYKNDDKFKVLQEKMDALMGADWSVPLNKTQEAKVDELISSIDEKHKTDTAQQLKAALVSSVFAYVLGSLSFRMFSKLSYDVKTLWRKHFPF